MVPLLYCCKDTYNAVYSNKFVDHLKNNIVSKVMDKQSNNQVEQASADQLVVLW